MKRKFYNLCHQGCELKRGSATCQYSRQWQHQTLAVMVSTQGLSSATGILILVWITAGNLEDSSANP